jgi:hypothetical protein
MEKVKKVATALFARAGSRLNARPIWFEKFPPPVSESQINIIEPYRMRPKIRFLRAISPP